MKKIKFSILQLIISISILFALVGCGNENTENIKDKNSGTEILQESKSSEVNENKKLTEVVPVAKPDKAQQQPVKTNSSGFQVAETIVPSDLQKQVSDNQEPLDNKAQSSVQQLPQQQPKQQSQQQQQIEKPVIKKVKCNIYHQGTEKDQMILINGRKVYVDKNGCIN